MNRGIFVFLVLLIVGVFSSEIKKKEVEAIAEIDLTKLDSINTELEADLEPSNLKKREADLESVNYCKDRLLHQPPCFFDPKPLVAHPEYCQTRKPFDPPCYFDPNHDKKFGAGGSGEISDEEGDNLAIDPEPDFGDCAPGDKNCAIKGELHGAGGEFDCKPNDPECVERERLAKFCREQENRKTRKCQDFFDDEGGKGGKPPGGGDGRPPFGGGFGKPPFGGGNGGPPFGGGFGKPPFGGGNGGPPFGGGNGKPPFGGGGGKPFSRGGDGPIVDPFPPGPTEPPFGSSEEFGRPPGGSSGRPPFGDSDEEFVTRPPFGGGRPFPPGGSSGRPPFGDSDEDFVTRPPFGGGRPFPPGGSSGRPPFGDSDEDFGRGGNGLKPGFPFCDRDGSKPKLQPCEMSPLQRKDYCRAFLKNGLGLGKPKPDESEESEERPEPMP